MIDLDSIFPDIVRPRVLPFCERLIICDSDTQHLSNSQHKLSLINTDGVQLYPSKSNKYNQILDSMLPTSVHDFTQYQRLEG